MQSRSFNNKKEQLPYIHSNMVEAWSIILSERSRYKDKTIWFHCEVLEQIKFIYSDRSKNSVCSGMVGIDQVGAEKELSRVIETQVM